MKIMDKNYDGSFHKKIIIMMPVLALVHYFQVLAKEKEANKVADSSKIQIKQHSCGMCQ